MQRAAAAAAGGDAPATRARRRTEASRPVATLSTTGLALNPGGSRLRYVPAAHAHAIIRAWSGSRAINARTAARNFSVAVARAAPCGRWRETQRSALRCSTSSRPDAYRVQDSRLPAGDLGHPAGVHERTARREIVRDDRLVHARDHEMHDPREDEHRSEQAPHARELYIGGRTAALLRISHGPLPRWSRAAVTSPLLTSIRFVDQTAGGRIAARSRHRPREQQRRASARARRPSRTGRVPAERKPDARRACAD